MIQLIEAPPRSGKSYMAVNYLCKFTQYDDVYDEYILDSKVLIISNIEGLRINHWTINHALSSHIKSDDKSLLRSLSKLPFHQWPLSDQDKLQAMKSFFSIDNFEKIMAKTGKTHIILCIDECHELFPSGFKDDQIYQFFAYHGHIGLDIILMCQSLMATSRMFNPLLEFVVKVTPRSRSVLNNFSYTYTDLRGRFLYSKSLAKKQSVFKAYKSFRQDEQSKPKNAVYHWIVICVVFFAVSGLLFKTALAIVKGKSETGAKKELVAKQKLAAMKGYSTVTPVPAPAVASAAPSPQFVAAATAATNIVAPSVNHNPPVAYPEMTHDHKIIGVSTADNERIYLLQNGSVRRSQKHYFLGEVYQ